MRGGALFIVICLVWLFGFVSPPQAQAYSFQHNPNNGRVRHWKRARFSPSLSFVLHEDGCPTIPAAQLQVLLRNALTAWNNVPCTFAKIEGGNIIKGVPAPTVDGNNTIRFITDGQQWQWSAGSVLEVVITANTRTGEITDTDILFNSWKFKFVEDAQASPQDWDFQAILTHAFGRALGLGYSNDKNAVLYGRINAGETGKRIISADDQKGLCDLYPKDAPCKEGENVGIDSLCYNGRVSPICAPYSELCKPCQSNEECRGDSVYCLQGVDSGVCGLDCKDTNACPKGYTCRQVQGDDGKIIGANCVPDDNTCANAASVPCCRNNDDCFPGYSCQLEVCVKTGVSDPCNNQCKPSEQCDQGKCVARACTNNDQCGVGWSCINSRCVQDGGCTGGCPDGQTCNSGRCVGTEGAACSATADCAAGLVCATGGGLTLCAKPCTAVSDCGNGFFCVSGLAGESDAACWPSNRSTCNDQGKCSAKGAGGCQSTGLPPLWEGLLLLLMMFAMRWRAHLQHAAH